MGIEAIYPKRRTTWPGAGTQDLPVFTAECGGHAARPGVGQRHHLRAAASRVLVPGGGDGLVQPLRARVAIVEHAHGQLLPGGAGRSARRRRKPEIFNSDQGSQFTATAFTSRLESRGVAISMDGRGRAIDNVFIERLWRSVKYEEVYLRDYADGWQAEASLAAYFRFYDDERIHQALGYRTPAEVYRDRGSSGGQPPDEKRIEIARNKLIAG